MIPGLVKTLERLKELHIKKNQDYTGKSKNPFFNFTVASNLTRLFEKNDDKVYSTLIGIKLGRLAALLNSDAKPNNESVLDSFDDLIVYSTIWRQDVERRLTEVTEE
jgi:hypothetical protein